MARATTPAEFVVALAVVGLCISTYHPAGMALLSRGMRQRGRALGLNGVCGNLGSAMAPFVAGVLAYTFGWRTAYVGLGVLGLLGGVISWRLRFDEGHGDTHAMPVTSAHSSSGESPLGSFALLCVAMMLAGFAYRGVALVLPATFQGQTTFVAAWLERAHFVHLDGVRNLAATLIASAVYAVGILGQIVGGHLADRRDLRALYVGFHAASLPFVVAMGFLAEWPLVLVSGAYVFFALGMQPIENSLVARFTPGRWRSTSYGVKFALNFGVGALGVYGVTALHRDASFAPVYLAVGGLVGLVCGVALLLWWRTRGATVRNEPAVAVLS